MTTKQYGLLTIGLSFIAYFITRFSSNKYLFYVSCLFVLIAAYLAIFKICFKSVGQERFYYLLIVAIGICFLALA